MSRQIETIYEKCKDEIHAWLDTQSWWIPPKTFSEITANILSMISSEVDWNDIYTKIYPVLLKKFKSDFKKYELPYLETLAEEYIDSKLPFEDALIDQLINDNVKKILDGIYDKVTEEK